MKRTIIALSIIIFFFGFNSIGFSAENSKIGIIDFKKIVRESSGGKITQKELKAKGEEFQKAILSEKKILDEMKKTFEREALVLSPEKQQEKQREFRIRVNDFKKMQQDLQQKFKQLEIIKLNEIQKHVFEIADEIGAAQGYALIIDKINTIYCPNKFDITDEIIKKYNLKVSSTN